MKLKIILCFIYYLLFYNFTSLVIQTRKDRITYQMKGNHYVERIEGSGKGRKYDGMRWAIG